MSKNKMQKRNGGFSLTEAVIALAIVVIITVAALTVVMSSIVAKVNAVNKAEAQGFAQNVWECFKASEDEGEFVENVRFALGDDTLEAQDIYEYESDRFNAKIEVDWNLATIEITVNGNKGEEIVSLNYNKAKGGGA